MSRIESNTVTLELPDDRSNRFTRPIRPLGVPTGLAQTELREYTQIPRDVECIYHPSFAQAATEEKLFGPGIGQIVPPAWNIVADTDDSEAHTRSRLTHEQEVQLFLRFNYARYRLAKLATAQARRASLVRAREMLRWHTLAKQAREALVAYNLALVLSMAKKSFFAAVDMAELVSEGSMALMRSVEKFDVSRGFRFSTYACGSILKAFGRLAQKVGRYRHFFPTEYDPELEQGDADGLRHDIQWVESVDELADVIEHNRAGLSRLEKTVIMERFGLANRQNGRTLAQVGHLVGLTNERVRQIQNHALLKLRTTLEQNEQ